MQHFKHVKNLSQAGVAHYIIPIAMVTIIAIVGGYVYLKGSSAATATGSDYLESGLSGKCLDDAYDKSTNGTKVQSYACNKSEAQQWTFNSNGTIENPNGKCIDNDEGKSVNDNPITVYTCSSTNKAEQWVNTGSILKNPTTDKCIDIPYASTKNGTAVQLYTCNGKSQQQWTKVATSTSTSGGGGSSTTATCSTAASKLQTLEDSFPGTTLNTSNWYIEPIAGEGNTLSGSVTVSGGILTLSQNTGYTSVNSQKSYDITSSCGFMKLIPDSNSTADQADSGWGIWNSTTAGDGNPGFSNGYEIGVQSGKLYVMVVVGDNVAPFSFSATYNPSTMAYTRIRESGGRLYFGYSANGSTWTEPTGWNIAWNSSIVNVKDCSVQIYAGNLGSKNAGSAAFADFNVAK